MLKSQGMSNRAIAHRLGVSEMAIRKLVGPSKPEGEQLALPAIPTAAEKPTATEAPSATLTGEDGDRTTASVEENTADRAPVTAPEAANDDELVPMSLETMLGQDLILMRLSTISTASVLALKAEASAPR
jgi:hypothetical protein